MYFTLELGEPDQAVSVAQQVHLEWMPFLANQSAYWRHYGHALARVRRRHDDAVRALRTPGDLPLILHRYKHGSSPTFMVITCEGDTTTAGVVG